jgi:hypothetical protein
MATANNKPSTVISIVTPEEVKLSGEKYFLLLKRALGLKFSDEGNNRKAIENILRNLSNEFARSIGVTPMSINTLKEEMTLIMDLLAMMEETEVLDSNKLRQYCGKAVTVASLQEAGWTIGQILKNTTLASQSASEEQQH